MGRENYVDVELIANPSVKRTMNVNSFKLNQKKWRLQGGQTLETALVKKKDVEPATNSGGLVVKPIINKAAFEEQKLPDEFAPPTAPDLSPEALIESLRTQYQDKYGKAPDGRWNVSRLTKEING